MSTEVSATTANASRNELPAIHLAAQRGDSDSLKKLVTPENVNDPADDGSFALQWAASGNHWEATRFLLEQGADPNLKGPLEATALHWVCRNGLVYMTRLLIEEGGADLKATDSEAYTPLHVAVHSSNVLMVIYLLHLEFPADPNAIDASGRSPLHWAAYQGDHLSTKCLLRAGSNPNTQDSEGFTPLHWALVSREQNCMELLVKAKTDLGLKNQDGKSCWVIAEEMDSLPEWRGALFAADRWPESGIPIPRRIKPWFAKGALFLLPLVLCPIFIRILMLGYKGVFTALVAALIIHKLCLKYLYPVVDRSQHAILQSPVLAGIYNGMYCWVVICYFKYVFPATWRDFLPLTIVFVVNMLLILVFWTSTVLLDPGTVPLEAIRERRAIINDLLDNGIYDGQHFCVHTWVLKPSRSQYSKVPDAVIARFDHYCPWTWNCIGIRNHRAFILYVTFLAADIWIYTRLYWAYLTGLDDSLQGAIAKTLPTAILYIGIFFQGAWITLLAVTQYIQIARGMTTAEFGHTHPSLSFSSLPQDHPLAGEEGFPAPQEQEHIEMPPRHHGSCFKTCLKVLGVHQAMVTSRSVRRKRKSGFGIGTNCSDFWCTGLNVIKPDSTGRLNGARVDYYTYIEQEADTPKGHTSSDAGNALRRIV